MERLSLSCELTGEGGEKLRICYDLTEDDDGGTKRYGLCCRVEGEQVREDQSCCLPGLFSNREMGAAALNFLAREGVAPQHIETVLDEMFA